jgi:hypothetical protein
VCVAAVAGKRGIKKFESKLGRRRERENPNK